MDQGIGESMCFVDERLFLCLTDEKHWQAKSRARGVENDRITHLHTPEVWKNLQSGQQQWLGQGVAAALANPEGSARHRGNQ